MTGGVVGTVIAVQEKRPRPRLSILEVVIADGTGPLKIVLFNQGYKKNFYKKGQRIYAYGKAEFQYSTMQMNTPHMENLGDGGEPDRGIVPIYALADGVSQFVVRSTAVSYTHLDIGTKPLKDFPFHLLEGYNIDWKIRQNYSVYFYPYKQYTIWGLTGRVLKRCV